MNHPDNSFERNLQSRFESHEVTPTIRADKAMTSQIAKSPYSFLHSFKWPLALASLSAIVIFTIFGALGSDNQEGNLDQSNIEIESVLDLLSLRQKDDPDMLIPDGKVLLLTVYMENCVFCERMEQSTCEDGDVKALLNSQFIRINIDLRDPKYRTLLAKYDVKAAPTSLFFDYDKEFLFKLQGFRSPEDYLEHLMIAIERSTSDTSDDLHDHDIHQHEVDFMNRAIQHFDTENGNHVIIDEYDLQSQKDKNVIVNKIEKRVGNSADQPAELKLKVYPNPSNGQFTIDIEGDDNPVIVRIFDVQGSGNIIEELTYDSFTGKTKFKHRIDGRSGYYLVQAVQGDKLVNERILIQNYK